MADNADNIFNSDHFDLTNWKLTLPVDSTGGTAGIAVDIKNLQGYESPYFYDSVDGAMSFTAMADGATTSGTKYARSELREMNGSQLAGWTLGTGGTMTATLKIDSVPLLFNGTPGKEIIGQIHGASNELCRLYWDNGAIYFKNDLSGTNNTENRFLLTDAAGNHPQIALGQKFSYMIDAHDGTLTVKVFCDGDIYSSVTPINAIWQSDTFYFKAGVYLGVNETQATGIGQTSFYGLDFSHTPGAGLGGLPAPLAQADNFSGQENQAITGNVLLDNGHGADSDPNKLVLGVTAETLATAHGNVVVNADGSFAYTPEAGFFGADGFTYTLKDSAGISASGTVDIAVNATPVAQPDNFTGQANNVITGNVLTDNGHGADSDPDGNLLTIAAQNLTTLHGSVALSANGAFVYTPVPGFYGTDSFEYTLSDGSGGSAAATVSLAVNTPLIPQPVVEALHGAIPVPTLIGTDGNDYLDGVHGHFNNVILGLAGDDTIIGHDGSDVLIGGAGNDNLNGCWGNDVIYSGEGNNKLYGGQGDDILISGSGQNTMTGGSGKDTFVLDEAKALNIHDIIADFNPLEDKLDISALLGQTGTASLQAVSAGKIGLYVDPDGAGAAHSVLAVTFGSASSITALTVLHDILA